MSASDLLETKILELLFTNAAFTNVGDAGGLLPSATAGSLYVSLHTDSPGEAGDQTTNECDYTDYARVAVARSGAGWTVTDDTVENAAAIEFPACGGGTNTATHFGIGTASSGAGQLLFHGELTAELAISNLVQPRIPAGDLTVSND